MILNAKNPHGGDIHNNKVRLDFSANINPLGTPNTVKAAVITSVDKLSAYPDPYCTRLRAQISAKEKVDSCHIICGNGAAELIYQYTAALKPKRALILAPGFCEYEDSLKAVNADIDYFMLEEKNQFKVTDAILLALTKRYDAVYLCNPNNPTGQVIKQELMEQILTVCNENQIYLFVDECFLEWLPKDWEHTLTHAVTRYPNLFVLKAFTKSYGMAGVRLGYGCCSDSSLLERMSRMSQTWNISTVAQECGIAALGCSEFLEQAKDLVAIEKNYLIDELGKMDAKVYGSMANYIFFRIRHTTLKEELLKRGIMIRSCSNYRGLTKEYYRIAVKKHCENEQLIQEMKEIIWQKQL